MADSKLTALSAFTPVLTDIIYGVDDPAAAKTPGKVTLTALLALFEANWIRASGVMSAQATSSAEATTDGTPRKITAWNTDGLETNMTVDSTTGNDITADVAGEFHIMTKISFSGTASKTFQVEIYVNGSATGFASDRKLGAGGDVGSAMACGLVDLSATDRIQVYHSSSDGGSAFTVTEAQLVAYRTGP